METSGLKWESTAKNLAIYRSLRQHIIGGQRNNGVCQRRLVDMCQNAAQLAVFQQMHCADEHLRD